MLQTGVFYVSCQPKSEWVGTEGGVGWGWGGRSHSGTRHECTVIIVGEAILVLDHCGRSHSGTRHECTVIVGEAILVLDMNALSLWEKPFWY